MGATDWSRRYASLRSGISSYLPHSEIEPPSKKESQRSPVLVPNFCSDFLDTCLAGLQEMDRPFNAQTLEIRHRGLSKNAL